jgi:RNA polymerase sigma-70 factor (ECF subfamily)
VTSTARKGRLDIVSPDGKPGKQPDAEATPFETFERHRSLLFGIAYRMLGEVAEAEDMVQETFLRWQRAQDQEKDVKSARAYLTTIITRLCIDQLGTARHQREQYVGVWLPDPLIVRDENDPAKAAQLAESVTNAFLLILETLSPVERAVFLLREVFSYEYDEVSRVVGKSESNCRKMVSRARERLATRRPRAHVDPNRARKLVQEFQSALEEGNAEGLLNLLAEDAAIYADGGGKVPATLKPLLGADTVAKFFTRVYRNAPAGAHIQIRFVPINAEPGMLVFISGKFEQAMTFEISDDRIRAIYVVRNPDKLRHLSAFAAEINGTIPGKRGATPAN